GALGGRPSEAGQPTVTSLRQVLGWSCRSSPYPSSCRDLRSQARAAPTESLTIVTRGNAWDRAAGATRAAIAAPAASRLLVAGCMRAPLPPARQVVAPVEAAPHR